MCSAVSVDLRQRVVYAVAAGASRHKAAERFGVSLASASRWCERFASEGHIAPKPMGGDQRWHGIEAQADLIVSRYEAQPGIYCTNSVRLWPSTASAWPRVTSRASSSATASREKSMGTRPNRTGRT